MMTYKIIEIEQNSDQWKEWRRLKIGASDAPAIMGCGFKTALQLWESKIAASDAQMNDAMQRGRALEPVARDWINERQGSFYAPKCLQSIAHDWMIASLDGMDTGAMPEVLEIKCPGERAHLQAVCGDIPEYYKPQLQHEMIVAGVGELLYLSFDGREGAAVIVERDEAYCRELIEREAEFYDKLMSFTPPDAVDKDYIRYEDEEAEYKEAKYRSKMEEYKALEEELSELKKSLIGYAAHPRVIIGESKIFKTIRKGNVEYDKIEALKGMNLEQYRKPPFEVWSIRKDGR